MGKIIDSKKLEEALQNLNKFMAEQELNKIESVFVIEQYLMTLKLFEKLDISKALRKALEKHGDMIK